MKKACLIFLLFCNDTVLNAMTEKTNITHAPITSLNDYTHFLKKQLQIYESDPTYAINLPALITMGTTITNNPEADYQIYDISTSTGNNVFHLAARGNDTDTLKTLFSHIKKYPDRFPVAGLTQCNHANETPFDICIKRLTKKQTVSHDTKALRKFIRYIAQTPDNQLSQPIDQFKLACLKKIITTALFDQDKHDFMAYSAHDKLLITLIPHNQHAHSTTILKTLCKQATDSHGNTFTHVLVQQQDPDKLYTWIHHKTASLQTNAAGTTPLDMAFDHFYPFIKYPENSDFTSPVFKKAHCCLFMLLNWCRLNSTKEKRSCRNCCNQHQITEDLSEKEQSLDYTLTWNKIHTCSIDYLNRQLISYKETGIVDIDTLRTIFFLITNSQHKLIRSIRTIRDKDHNTILHMAIIKQDLATVQWLCNNNTVNLTTQKNKDDKSAFDLCIDQLLDKNITDKDTALALLLTLTYHIQQLPDWYSIYKNEFLEKLIMGEIECKKNGLTILDDTIMTGLFTCLVPPHQDTSEYLTPFYQRLVDTQGNSITHAVAEQGDSDAIYNIIQQQRISLAHNSAHLTPVDIALHYFRHFTQNTAGISTDQKELQERRCCLFMLLNYRRSQNKNNSIALKPCCDRHIL